MGSEKGTQDSRTTFTFTYTGTQLTQTTDVEGIVRKLRYDGNGRLFESETPDPDDAGSGQPLVTRFLYSDKEHLRRVQTLRSGVILTDIEYTYDDLGQLDLEIQHTELIDGDPATVDYDGDTSLPEIIDADDPTVATLANPANRMGQTELFHSVVRMPLGRTQLRGRNFAGDVVKKVFDSGDTWIYQPTDDHGLPVLIVQPSVTVNGVEQTLQTLYDYDFNGNLLRQRVESNGFASGFREESWTYGVFSQVASYTDRLGRITDYTLDSRGNLIRMKEPAAGILDVITDFAVFPASDPLKRAGLVQSMTLPDPDGDGPLARPVYNFNYNAHAMLISIEQPNGTTLSFAYDSLDRPTTVTNEAGTTIRRYANYNAFNLPRTVYDADGSSEQRVTTYEYDADENVLQVTLPTPAVGPAPVYRFEYTNRGQLESRIDPNVAVLYPDGSSALATPVTSYAYDAEGRLVSLTDPAGQMTLLEYDVEGHLIRQTLPDPDGAGGRSATVLHFEYDDRDRLTRQFVDAGSGATLADTQYRYDPEELLLEVRDALANAATTYEYDAVGNLVRTVDPRGSKTEFVYNGQDDLLQILQADPGTGQITSNSPTWSFLTDALGRQLRQTDPLNRVTKWNYDVMSRLTQETLPDPDGIGGPLQAPFTTFAYTSTGDLDFVQDHLGRKTDYTYDVLGRMTRVDSPDPDGGGPLPSLSQSMIYDDLDRVNGTEVGTEVGAIPQR